MNGLEEVAAEDHIRLYLDDRSHLFILTLLTDRKLAFSVLHRRSNALLKAVGLYLSVGNRQPGGQASQRAATEIVGTKAQSTRPLDQKAACIGVA